MGPLTSKRPRISRRAGAWSLGLLLLAAAPARADWTVSAGADHFQWTEHTAPLAVQETGFLPALRLRLGHSFPNGSIVGYRGRVYFGDVNYEGSMLYQPSVPVSGTTRYGGLTQQAELGHRIAPDVAALIALELDFWHRKLGPDQAEDYRIVSMRLGAEHDFSATVPLHVAGGAKFTLSTHENAHFGELGFQRNPPLEPAGSVTPYFELGYALGTHWALAGSFDAYTFGRSNLVYLQQGTTQGVFFQPASDMRAFGLRLEYR